MPNADPAPPISSSGSPSCDNLDSQSPEVIQSPLLALLVRYHWLGGCISEHLKQFEDATQQFEACQAALDVDVGAAPSVRPTSSGQPPISAALVNSRLARLKMVAMVEEGRQGIEKGQQQQLIARLGPFLLAVADDAAMLEVPQHLEGLSLLQVSR